MTAIAHLSDLHIGSSPKELDSAILIRNRLRDLPVDHILVTGDITENGRTKEYAQFKEVFAEFIDSGICTMIPGNHDRLGNDVAKDMMRNERIEIVQCGKIRVIAIDSTTRHGLNSYFGKGSIDRKLIDEIGEAVDGAGPGRPVIVALHHHLVPQPEEYFLEKIATFFKTSIATELQLGQDLIQRLVGRADLVLHGHRHVPLETQIAGEPRPLTIFNAGSSTLLGKFRMFHFADGKLAGQPEWIETY